MINTNISIQDRTKQFAVRVVNAYTEINERNHFSHASVTLAKQFLRSGTSIGANCKEGVSAQSTRDFISKYEIALKEARETEYWVEVMIESNVIPEQKFSPLLKELDAIIRILASSIPYSKIKSQLLTSDF
jgi:four helix bundle protein